MKKGKRIGYKHAKCYTVLCDWCGDRKEVSRSDTATCGDVCRKRMSVFVRFFGYKPDAIVGPFTAKDAIDKEVKRLITLEQRRRAAAAAEKKAFLARPGA